MSFNMSPDSKMYFNKINRESKSGKFQTQFDFYYLCLIMGLIKKELKENIGEKFLDEFPSDYHAQREQILGLLISSEIERKGVDFDDRKKIEETMLKMVKPDSPTRLSETGEKLVNQYAQGGFELISNKIPSAYNLDTFLIHYYKLLISKK
jgi:hypothetical protein